jgi:hypothetical protein
MPRKKPRPRWDHDPVQPIRITNGLKNYRLKELVANHRFRNSEWEEICRHLAVKTDCEKVKKARSDIEYLCAQAARTWSQDEGGPSRGERTAALKQFIEQIDATSSAIDDLMHARSNSLSAELSEAIGTSWQVPSSPSDLLTGSEAGLGSISRSVARLSSKSLESNQKQLDALASGCLSIAGMLQGSCDVMHPEFMFRLWHTYKAQQSATNAMHDDRGIDQLRHRLNLLKATTVEFHTEYKGAGGPRTATTLTSLANQLADIYEDLTGRDFTHSHYNGYAKYTGRPTSHGDTFIVMVLGKILDLDQKQLNSSLRQVISQRNASGKRKQIDQKKSREPTL